MRIAHGMLVVLLLVGVGCGDNDNSAPVAEPSAALQCEVVGTLCHDAETAAGHACHELGHEAVPSTCAAEFPACIAECLGDGGDPFCRALGRLCHDVQTDDAQACHDLGHGGDPSTCRAQFDRCAALCL